MRTTGNQEILPPIPVSDIRDTRSTTVSAVTGALQTTARAIETITSGKNAEGVAIAINISVTPIRGGAPNKNNQVSHPLPRPQSVKAEAVERIISRCLRERSNLFPGRYFNRLIHMATLPDGTAVAVVEDPETGVRHHWTVCPETFAPKRLGFANL